MLDRSKVYEWEKPVDMFIIPNKASYIKDFFLQSTKDDFSKVLEANGLSDDPEDKAIQIWMTTETCNNMNDHYFRLTIDDEPYLVRAFSFLPNRLLEGHEEGDTIELIVPCTAESKTDYNAEPQDIFVKMSVKLCQTEYRYRNFGKFENALRYVS